MTRTLLCHFLFVSFIAFGVFNSSDSVADLKQKILSQINNPDDPDYPRKIRPEVTSLKVVPVPEPSNLYDFVKNKQRAIELGKALFWDMQVGSDNVQACASCHFNAGADSRTNNQLSPGLKRVHQNGDSNKDITFDPATGPNYLLRTVDFPLHVKSDPILFYSDPLRDTNDVVSSQGVLSADIDWITYSVTPDPDGFSLNGTNTRRVEPRNTPTVINAVFNHRQFWDGRASNVFNGVNPMGENDPNATVYELVNGNLKSAKVRIDNASLASQALGPPISSFEMSDNGQTWVEIGDEFVLNRYELDRKKGRRLSKLRPLGLQKVHPNDSVLGELAVVNDNGLKVTYTKMIKQAFKAKWWKSDACIRINADGSRTVVNQPVDEHIFNQMEMNFSLFFGLAIQLYEATLVSNDSPVDKYLEGNTTALTDDELVGMHIADDEGRCFNCHDRGEFTRAAVSRIERQGLTRIRKGDLIDEGFNNIGVRPTLEDLGVGGIDDLGNPLSFGRKIQLDPNAGTLDQQAANLGADGAFKIPTLRNVELTAPYFHNGGESTLEGVIDFYFRGGNFRTFDPGTEGTHVDDKHTIIGYDARRVNESRITGLGILRGPEHNSGPGLDDADKGYLVAFLKALTDERVRYQQAPFDHPQIKVPNGHPFVTCDYSYYYYPCPEPGTQIVLDYWAPTAVDKFINIPEVGANGSLEPLPTFSENLAP